MIVSTKHTYLSRRIPCILQQNDLFIIKVIEKSGSVTIQNTFVRRLKKVMCNISIKSFISQK